MFVGCVCVCVFACFWAILFVHTWCMNVMSMCGGQRLVSGIFLSCSPK